jgi:glycosyltransferase involved in cell wall biosynthesis
MSTADHHRILLISSNSSEAGGGERYLDYLAKGLLALGHDVHVLYSTLPYMDGWARMLEATGAKVHRLPLKGLRHRPLRFLQSIVSLGQQKRICRFVRELAPDGVLVNMQYDEDGLDYYMGAAGAKPRAIAGVVHMPMTFWKNERPLGRLRGRMMACWYRWQKPCLIMVSDGCKDEFDRYYGMPDLTRTVRNGIPWTSDSKSLSQSTGGNSDAPLTIGFAGRFDPQKGLDTLVKAWLLLEESGERFRLLLIGDGVDRPKLENLLREKAPKGDWSITGWVDNPEDWMSRVDLLVMTSRFEGLSLALVEAAGRGMPCVITPVNGSRDVADKASWVFIAPDHSVDSVANAIRYVASKLRSGIVLHTPEQLSAFRAYFSTDRMARETVEALFDGRGAA